ncbi:MAG TPA: site-specific DNA-methyltransferase [bacterium]|nr:site-specific DNA-methyltransferase [bacterium]
MSTPDPAKKLKRTRLRNKQDGRIRLRKPTGNRPALREYIPAHSVVPRESLETLPIIVPNDNACSGTANLTGRILCMDALDGLSRLEDRSIHLIVTSPPYWNVVDYGVPGQLGQCNYEEYLDQLLKVWAQCERVLVPNGKLCINTPIMPISKSVLGDRHTRQIKNLSADIEATILSSLTLERFSLFVWQKQTTEKMFGSYPYPPNLYEQNTIEFISVFVKDGPPRRIPAAVKEASRLTETEWMDLTRQVWYLYPEDVQRASHPAPFPQSLPNRLIALYTFRAYQDENTRFSGDIVLDPFCGTGATCIAAKRLGRRWIGIDNNPDFCIEAARRVTDAEYDGRIFLDKWSKTK